MHQPLLLERPLPTQLVMAVAVPALFGLLTGYLLGVTEIGYLVLSLLGILGGFAAGYDHRGAGEGFQRGILGGLLFGVFILVGHSVFGQEAKATLPHPHVLLPVITTVLGSLLGAWGGARRARAEQRRAAAPA